MTYEGLRQTLEQTIIGQVPTDTFRAQVAAQSPALAAIVHDYPEGTIQENARIAKFIGKGMQLDHENSAMLRVDQRFSNDTTAFLRFNIDEAVSEVPLGTLGDRQDTSSRPVNGVIDVLQVFSSTLLNDAKFGFNRSTVRTANGNLTGLPYSLAVSGFNTGFPAQTFLAATLAVLHQP